MKQMNKYTYHWGMVLRIYPNHKGKRLIRVNGGAYNFVYNRRVAYQNELYNLRKVKIYIRHVAERIDYLKNVCSDASFFKSMHPFLNEPDIDSDVVLNAFLNYQNAWKMHNEVPGVGIPTFHKKDGTYSYKTSNHYTKKSVDGLRDGSIYFIDKKYIHLPKIGKVRFKGSDKLIVKLLDSTSEIRMGSVKISMDILGNCYASLSFASDDSFFESYEPTYKACGFDLNLDNFLWDSDNNVTPNPRYKKNTQGELAKAQKKLSRKLNKNVVSRGKHGKPTYAKSLNECRNYQKQRRRVASIHMHIARRRNDFQYAEANRIVKSHDYIFAEDLKVRNLLKNHKLAYAISDVGWSSFLEKVAWVAEKNGKLFMKVPPHYTTQTCSTCGHVMKGDENLTLSDREWTCPNCGTYHVRDYNASVNIMNRGLEVLKSAGITPTLH